MGTLRAELLRRAGGAGRSHAEAQEAVDAVIEAFVRAALDGRIRAETAGAYIARSLAHRLVDVHRRTTSGLREVRSVSLDAPGGPDRGADDEALARLLDAQAARSDVLRGLRHAAQRRRFTVVRVIAEWLDIAERTGVEPTSREIGDALGLSHTAVNDALREFREEHLPGR